MGPLWSGQGTVAHTTLSDILSTDVVVNSLGAPLGAEREEKKLTQKKLPSTISVVRIPAVVVLIDEVTVLLLILLKTAVTLTKQVAPKYTSEMVYV